MDSARAPGRVAEIVSENNNAGVNRLRFDLFVVGGDGVGDDRRLPVAFDKFGADMSVRTLEFAGGGFADIVK